ncbi:MAG: hypothetical protein IJU50_08055 [Lachnospiraceae bacterium]|nr:hypothetical protein [Lachnospiraceae bacterium]
MTILKFSAFFLIAVLIAIAVCLWLLLFCPFAYELRLDGYGAFAKTQAEGKLSFLWFLLRVSAIYPYEKSPIIVRVLGIPLHPPKKKKQEKKEKKEIEKKYSIFEEICGKINKLWSVFQKLQALAGQADYKEAAGKVWHYGKKILCSIRPRKLKGQALLGLEEPDKTAYLHGALSLLDLGKLSLEPSFNGEIFEGDVSLKGRVFLFVIVFQSLLLLKEKSIRDTLGAIKSIQGGRA